jgi:hypothetical protein
MSASPVSHSFVTVLVVQQFFSSWVIVFFIVVLMDHPFGALV